MDIFNNREWALIVWAFAVVFFALVSPRMGQVRICSVNLLKALCTKVILRIFASMLVYITVIIYGLFRIGLWESHQLKNTVVWTASVAAVYLFRLESAKNEPSFFRNLIVDNLKLTAIIQFICGVYVFGFIFELIFLPLLVILGGMLAVSQNDRKDPLVEKTLNSILVAFGIILIGYAIYMLLTHFEVFTTKQTMYDFFIPPLLTLLYLPYILIMMVFTTYELVCLKINLFIKDPIVRRFAKFYSLNVFHFNLKILERWACSLSFRDTSTKDGVKNSVKQIFKMVATEKKPPKVQLYDGWSPYEAKCFLISEGLQTGYYHPVAPDEWFANSPLVEIGDDLMSNNISYYIKGDETIANSLLLILNVNSCQNAEASHLKLLSSVKALLRNAINVNASMEIETSVIQGECLELNLGICRVTLEKNEWPLNSVGGYDIRFILSNL